MILTAHQPVYLPWLGLFHKIALSDTYVYLDTVKYLKQDWNNRNRIKTAEGPAWLTVPVATSQSDNWILKDVKIVADQKWRIKHWRTIANCYRRAPYFNRYSDFFETVYGKEWQTLSELNLYMLQWFLDTLDIRVRLVKASDYNFEGHKSDLILNMCKQLEATTYIFGEQGHNYAELGDFESAGVSVIFQNYTHPKYDQRFGNFVAHLSIIDLLFNCGSHSTEILLGDNTTREDVRRQISSNSWS